MTLIYYKPTLLTYRLALTLFFACILMHSATAKSEYIISHPDINDKLVSKCISKVLFDKSGYLWISTFSGINRFDGNSLITIPITEKRLNCSIADMMLTDDNQIIVSTNPEYYIIQDRKIIWHGLHLPLPIEVTVNNITYFAIHSRSLLYDRKKVKYDDRPNGLLISTDTAILFGEEGFSLYAQSKKLFHYKATSYKYYKNIAVTKQFFLYHDKEQNKILAWSRGSLAKDVINVKPGTKVISVTNGDDYLLVENDKLYRLFVHAQKIEREFICYFEKELFSYTNNPSRAIGAVTSPKPGYYTLGTGTNGIYEITPKLFKTYTDTNHLTFKYLYVVDTNTIFSFRGRELLKYDGHRKKFDKTHTLKDITAIVTDKTGTYWKIYSKNWNNVSVNFSDNITDIGNSVGTFDIVTCLHVGKSNTVYFDNFVPGRVEVYSVKNKTATKLFEFPSNKTTRGYINCLYEQDSTNLWVANNDGLLHYNKASNQIHEIELLKNVIVTRISEIDGIIYFLTYGNGIYALRDNKIVKCTLDRSQMLNFSHTIYKDKKNRFWISTNNGLIVTNTLFREEHPVHYVFSNKKHGMLSNEFNKVHGSTLNLLSGGVYTLPTTNGIVYFQPDSIELAFPTRGINIDEITVNESNIIDSLQESTITSEDYIKLKISIPYFGETQNLHVQYAIVGDYTDTSKWQEVDNFTFQIGRLRPGRKKILFRITNSLKNDSYLYTDLDIYITPKWHESIVVQIIIGGIILLIIIFITIRTNRKRVKKLQQDAFLLEHEIEIAVENLNITNAKLNDELHLQDQLISIVSHDIIGSLYSLKSLLNELIRENIVSNLYKPVMQDIVGSVSQITQYSESIMDKLLSKQVKDKDDNRTSSSKSISDIIKEQWEIFSIYTKLKNIELIEEGTDVPAGTLSYLIQIIANNLISNSIKYTKSGVIAFSTQVEKKTLHMHISDTGSGYTSQQIASFNSPTDQTKDKPSLKKKSNASGYGKGLSILRNLIIQEGGTIIIGNNTPDPGSHVIITLPYSND